MPGCRAIQALYEAIAVPPGNQRTSLSTCQNAKSDLSRICSQGGGAAGRRVDHEAEDVRVRGDPVVWEGECG